MRDETIRSLLIVSNMKQKSQSIKEVILTCSLLLLLLTQQVGLPPHLFGLIVAKGCPSHDLHAQLLFYALCNNINTWMQPIFNTTYDISNSLRLSSFRSESTSELSCCMVELNA